VSAVSKGSGDTEGSSAGHLNGAIMATTAGILRWTPRIICILAILFVSMFALDAFARGLTVWQQLAAFFMHLIPSFVLLALLIIAWKWELTGGIVFIIIGLLMSFPIFLRNYRMNHSILMSLAIILAITFPFVLAGVLFVLSHRLSKRNASAA
jgi:hypothetical protein